MSSQRETLPPIAKSMTRSHHSHTKERKPKIGEYINESLSKINTGCYKDGRLCIDGGYGDYCMSIFRLKDRKKRFNEASSFLSEQIIAEKDEPSQDESAKETINSEASRPKVAEWTGEEEQYLYYQYVPEYQKERWFRKPTPMQEVKPETQQTILQESKVSKTKKPRKSKQTHFFRFLDQNFTIFSHSS